MSQAESPTLTKDTAKRAFSLAMRMSLPSTRASPPAGRCPVDGGDDRLADGTHTRDEAGDVLLGGHGALHLAGFARRHRGREPVAGQVQAGTEGVRRPR